MEKVEKRLHNIEDKMNPTFFSSTFQTTFNGSNNVKFSNGDKTVTMWNYNSPITIKGTDPIPKFRKIKMGIKIVYSSENKIKFGIAIFQNANIQNAISFVDFGNCQA